MKFRLLTSDGEPFPDNLTHRGGVNFIRHSPSNASNHRFSGLLRVLVASIAVILMFFPIVFWTGETVVAQQAARAEITSPQNGQTILGLVNILGSASSPNFQRYKVEFASEETDTATWTTIGEVTQQVNDNPLGQWDTTTIKDGRYQLRLRVILRDGTVLQTVVAGLIVQNTLPTPFPTVVQPTSEPPTATVPTGPEATSIIQLPPTNTPRPTLASISTIPPTNPPTIGDNTGVSINSIGDSIGNAFCGGVYIAVFGFGVLGVYWFIQSRLRSGR